MIETATAADTKIRPEIQFTPQQVGAAVSTLVSATIGEIAVLFSKSPAHKHFMFADMEWMILPAVLTSQAYVAELEHKVIGARAPVAAVLWASVSDEIDRRLAAAPGQRIRLRPDEWASGDNVWVVDVAGTPDAIAGALAAVARGPLEGKTVKMILPGADGKPHVANLHDMLARAEARAG